MQSYNYYNKYGLVGYAAERNEGPTSNQGDVIGGTNKESG